MAQAIFGPTRATIVSELYSQIDPVPVVIRSAAGENLAAGVLEAIDGPTAAGEVVPRAQVAHIAPVWQPAAIKHRNGQRIVTASSQLVDGYVFSDVLASLQDSLATVTLPPLRRDGDASILAIATQKAHKARVGIDVRQCLSTGLPFADGRFDRIVSSLFFHHLTTAQKCDTAREAARGRIRTRPDQR